MKKILWVASGSWLALAGAPAMAVDGIAVEAGNGDGTDMGRVAIQWDWNKPLLPGRRTGTSAATGTSGWATGSNNGFPGRNKDITEIGLTPVFRLQRNGLTGPYAELGVGVHLLSAHHDRRQEHEHDVPVRQPHRRRLPVRREAAHST